MHARFLEYFYPLSVFCGEVNNELLQYSYQVKDVFESPNRSVSENQVLLFTSIAKNLGTILHSLVQLDDCYETWDGICAGKKLGEAAHGFVDTSVLKTSFI